MLVPVQGGVGNFQKRNRTIHEQRAALETVNLPSVYIYNVGPREWKGVGGGQEYRIPACPRGERHSKPVEIPILCLSERDLADGGNNLDTIMDAGLSGMRKVAGEQKQVIGVANDVIGHNSTSPGLDLYTTNGAWFGVFVSQHLDADGNPEPLEEEIEEARDKLKQMAGLIYQTGAEKVAGGEKVSMVDRARYNWSAEYLGTKPLWGNLEHTMDQCPLCHEDIREGAKVCKHCGNAIDEDSIRARAFALDQQNKEVLTAAGEEESKPKPAAKVQKKGRGN